MNSLKKFHIQWAWLVTKDGTGTGLFIAASFLVFAFVGVVVFMLGFLHNQEGERIISNNLTQIIGGISALVFFYLYFIGAGYAGYSNSSKNFKIAIDKAEKFVAENPECFPKINILIVDTIRTKNPAKLNEWIDNWRKLSSTEANMQGLEKEKEDIEKGIPLEKVNVKIKAEKERIEELESKLA